MVNSADSLQTQYTYDPFGNVTTTGQASPYPYLFGRMELDSSGLYHTQSRYYDPTFGRFLSADSGLPPNAFTYAGNSPIDAVDPTGMAPEGICDANCQVAAESDQAVLVQDNNPGLGGLLGALIQGLIDLFGGGGGSQIVVIPPGLRRIPHYPAGQFIGVPTALVPAQENPAPKEPPCIEQLMLVTAYSVVGPTKSGGTSGPGTVAEANTSPPPYPFGCSVTVYDSPAGTGGILYRGTIQDTGRGWNYINHKHPNHSRVVPPNDWMDIWLPASQAGQFGVQWKWVRICR